MHIGDLRFQRKASGQSKRLKLSHLSKQSRRRPTLAKNYPVDIEKRGSFTRNAWYTTFYAVISLLRIVSRCTDPKNDRRQLTMMMMTRGHIRHTTQPTFSSLEKCYCLEASRYVVLIEIFNERVCCVIRCFLDLVLFFYGYCYSK